MGHHDRDLARAASAHLFCTTASLQWGRATELFGPRLLSDDITVEPATYKDGYLLVTNAPGFGVTIDEDKVAKLERP